MRKGEMMEKPELVKALERITQAAGEFTAKYRAGFRDLNHEFHTLCQAEQAARIALTKTRKGETMKKSTVKKGMLLKSLHPTKDLWETVKVLGPVASEDDMFWVLIERAGKPAVKGTRYASELRLTALASTGKTMTDPPLYGLCRAPK